MVLPWSFRRLHGGTQGIAGRSNGAVVDCSGGSGVSATGAVSTQTPEQTPVMEIGWADMEVENAGDLGRTLGISFPQHALRRRRCRSVPPSDPIPFGTHHPARWVLSAATTGPVWGSRPRQMRNDSAACSTSMPSPSLAIEAPSSSPHVTNGVGRAAYAVS